MAYGRHLPEHVPRDRPLILGQPGVDRLGAGLDGAGHPAGPVVARPGQPAVLAVLPGQRQGLGEHGQRGAVRAGVGHDGVDESALNAQPARLGRAGDRVAQAGFRHRADHQVVPLHGRDELRMSGAPVPVVPADRDHHPGRRLASRPGRPGGCRAYRLDERGPFGPVLCSVRREDLLELVDDQDQPGGGAGAPGELADQQVRLAWRVGQPLPDGGRIPPVQRRQPGGQVGERPRGHGKADHGPARRPGHLHATGERGHQAGPQQRGLAGARGAGDHDDPGPGEQARQLGDQALPAAEYRRVRLVIGQQPAVRAAVPARARGGGFGRLQPPPAGPLLDDREFLADQADVGQLPGGPLAGGPQLGALAVQAVLDLAGRAGQIGQHEGHVTELGAQRFQRGEHLALDCSVSGLDRGAEHRAARVDFPHHHRDVGSQLAGVLVARGQDFPDGPADLRFQVPG